MPEYQLITATQGLYLEPDSSPYTSGAMSVDAQVIDGVLYTNATANAWQDTFSYGANLGSAKDVAKIRLGLKTSGNYGTLHVNSSGLKIYKSSDNSTWTLVETFDNPTVLSYANTEMLLEVVLASVQTDQYFKAVAYNNSYVLADDGFSGDPVYLGEFQAFEEIQTGEVTDGIEFSDSVSAIAEYEPAASDEIILGDTVEAFSLSDVFTDGITLGDSVEATIEKHAEITDGLEFSDSLDRYSEVYRTVSDGLEFSDSLLAFNWAWFLDTYGDRCITLFYFTLTGSADSETDIEIPIKSFQGRIRSGDPTYLSVVIPSIDDYSAAVTARSSGDLVIEMSYILDGTEQHREEIARVELEDIRTYEGAVSQSITLSGHKTETFVSKVVDLRGVTLRELQADGKLKFRCTPPDLYLKPGDTARYGTDSITVGLISYTVSVDAQTMEVTEA